MYVCVCVCVCVYRERDRARDRETETEAETETDRYRETETERQRQTGRETERQTKTDRDRQTDIQNIINLPGYCMCSVGVRLGVIPNHFVVFIGYSNLIAKNLPTNPKLKHIPSKVEIC